MTPKPIAAAEIVNPCQAGLDGLLRRLEAEPLFGLGGPEKLAVAFSGGADSTALLLAAAARCPDRVVAIHVHHGLQAAANGFEEHCRKQCELLGIPLLVCHVNAKAARGESPEDAARKARYSALAQACMAAGLTEIALAQHADDQVETMLLALSRGAGLPGLAAMPAQFERAGVHFHRPLLAVGGPAIRAWLALTGRSFVEDPSNANLAFTRNSIRHRLLPALESCFPAFRETFARSARHAAQAKRLLETLAENDLAQTGVPPGIAALQELASERQANALRHWLRTAHRTAATEAQLAELQKQLAACRTRGHRLHIKVGDGYIERRGKTLHYLPLSSC